MDNEKPSRIKLLKGLKVFVVAGMADVEDPAAGISIGGVFLKQKDAVEYSYQNYSPSGEEWEDRNQAKECVYEMIIE